ncbi:membrane protein [Bordetella pertussis]|nr:inner membrane protein [Bordetella pertussis]CFO03865.1 inner membrane protein [Bordetella pertussis]CFO32058.1 inner membrane protein [Bordetella pertussis]CFO41334.1 inner membrane protein [Bordetella pertussis]CFP09831.1 inner membrane protein [Bordetella pertussis]
MPRWLVLLLVGIALGAGGVLFLQTNYGPQRLTVEQSEQLHTELSAANLERQRLQTQLDEAIGQRDANKSTHEQLTTDLAQARTRIDTLNQELLLFQDAMPPDPRGGDIGVRSAVFKRQPGQLSYQVLIMRENHAGPAFKGNVTLAIEGNYANGRRGTLTPDPLALDLQRYNNTQGVLPLPDGFTPRSVTIRVLDGQQKQHAMRIYYVRG